MRAGLSILEAIQELNEVDPDLDLKVRVGINTGEAVVAVGARPEQGEGLVTGDVVNTAARIQSAAPVDGVAVAEHTRYWSCAGSVSGDRGSQIADAPVGVGIADRRPGDFL